jgi:uncharacterized spore protein YtfJ
VEESPLCPRVERGGPELRKKRGEAGDGVGSGCRAKGDAFLVLTVDITVHLRLIKKNILYGHDT